MDRRTLIAISLCFMIFVGWQKLYIEPRLPAPVTQQAAQTQAPSAGATTVSSASNSTGSVTSKASEPKREPKPLELETGVGTAMIGDGNQLFSDWKLKSYKRGLSVEAATIDLGEVTHQLAEGELLFDSPEFSYLAGLSGRGTLSRNGNRVVWLFEDDKIRISRESWSEPGKLYVDVKYDVQFKGAQVPKFAFLSLSAQSPAEDVEAQDRQLVYFTNKTIERVQLSADVNRLEAATPVQWIGTTSRYFVLSFINQSPVEPRALIESAGHNSGRISLVYPVQGNAISIPFKAFFGPKELDTLRAVEPTLDHVVDFGWFTAFAYPLLRLMKWFYAIFHNWGVSIILLTLLVKVVTFPLTYKSMKSMKEMAKLQPQLQKLREKYADDKEALNREMLTVMRTHGYNPAAGCLPILIQMPVFIALYRVLYGSIELYHAPFAAWVVDLSSKDPFYVTPVLLTLTMYIQQKLTPNTATDPMQAKMMQFMPLIFGAMMVSLPSGLTLYMLVNALASIAQQIILNKKLDIKHPVAAMPVRVK